MFVEDYRELKIENAENIAARCFLFEKFVADLLAQEPEALRFKRARGERPDPPALPCQIDSQSGVHGHAGRTFAWKKSHYVGHSVLRNGRRIRRARRKIRSIAPSRATLARSNRQSTPRDRSNRVRHKLPPSNYRPNKSPAKTHGRVARRSDRVTTGAWTRPGRDNWRFAVKNRCASDETDSLVSSRAEESSQTRGTRKRSGTDHRETGFHCAGTIATPD